MTKFMVISFDGDKLYREAFRDTIDAGSKLEAIAHILTIHPNRLVVDAILLPRVALTIRADVVKLYCSGEVDIKVSDDCDDDMSGYGDLRLYTTKRL